MSQKELLRTKYIKNALKRYAIDNLTPISECDFQIHKIDTLVKDKQNPEFVHYPKELLKTYLHKEKILQDNIEFSQIYTFSVMKKQKKTLKLLYTIELENHAAHPKLILSPQSTIPYKLYEPIELLKLLYNEFNKIKVFHHILIKIFDTSMKNALKAFVKYIYHKEFSEKISFPLFDGIEPIMARQSELILHFKEKKKSERVISVEKNELLIEYKKPLYGRNGFNAFGKIIDNIHTDSIDKATIEFDAKSIQIKEDESSELYISKQKGYVHYDGLHIAVDNTLKLNEVSRYEKIIDLYSQDNDTDMIISQKDITEDSIGEGTKLISETIQVKGFVGANSHLEALHLDIQGATHQNSKQFARFAKINRHKGTLRCHKAKIALLEGGVVHASQVEIDASIGGQIFAEDVIIGHTKNNLKVYASNSITVHLASGEENLFKISYQEIPILCKKIEYIQEEIEELTNKLKQARRFKPHNIQLINDEITTLKNEIYEIQNAYKTATISVKEAFQGLNHIVFTIDQKNEIHYKTENQAYPPFHLEIEKNKITLLPPDIFLFI